MTGLNIRVREQIRRWRDDLINLSRINRLLYFRHTKTSTLEVTRPSVGEILSRLDAPSSKGWRFYIPPFSEGGSGLPAPYPDQDELLTSKTDEASLLATLRALERKAAQEFMDKGLWVLYLGVGMLEWIDADDQERVNSPIWLVPVTVQRENPREPFRLRRAEGDPLVNPALAVKLSNEFGIELPSVEDLEETVPDVILARFSAALKPQPEWHVSPRVVLSTFSFHKEVMYRDLLNNEETIANHPLIISMALGSAAEIDLDFEPVPEEVLDDQAPPEHMASILDTDASQRQCILAAKDGRSFVMDGPPGTGKSQTISNIIVELLAVGKTVLFVSEKAAALEVVHSRLDAAGLTEFLLALHSHKATRREVAQELGRAMTIHPRPPRGLGSAEVQKLIERRRELSAYAAALNELRQPLGNSLHEVIGRIGQLHEVQSPPPISLQYATFDSARFTRLVDLATSLSRAWGPVERIEDFLWRELNGVDFGPARITEIHRLLQNSDKALSEYQTLTEIAAEELRLPWVRSTQDSSRLIQLLNLMAERPSAAVAWLTSDALEPICGRISYLHELTDLFRRITSSATEMVGVDWRNVDAGLSVLFEDAISKCETLEPAWAPPFEASVTELQTIGEFLRKADVALTEIQSEAEAIAQRFGLPPSQITILRARELAELGSLVGAPTHPEASWLNPAVLVAVRSASEALKALIDDYKRKQNELTEVFSDSILEIPNLADLCVRFEGVHRGFGRFRKQCRQDRRQLAGCTRTGKVRTSTLHRLRDALAWQELTVRLKEAETSHAGVLGSYYLREVTDFGALTSALEIAQRALDLTGRQLDVESLSRQLALGGQPDPDLLPRANSLLEQVDSWNMHARSVLGSQADLVTTESLAQTRNWCKNAAPIVATLLHATSEVCRVAGSSKNVEETRQILGWRHQVELIEKEVEQDREVDIPVLGPAYSGLETDWVAMESAISWADVVRTLTEGAIPKRSAERILTSEMKSEYLIAARMEWEKRRDEIGTLFLDRRSEELVDDLDVSFEDGHALLQRLIDTRSDIQEWLSFSGYLTRLNDEDLESTTTFCIEQRLPAHQVSAAIEKCLLESWVDHVFREELEFSFISRKDRDQCLEDFRELDRKLISVAAGRVIEACNGRRPRTNAGIAGTIVNEAQKKKRHMPIRRLIGETAPVVQALKPCFMMSPLTVSQFLLPTVTFDTVIFDEASQVTPADAVNCIYRGQQVIVAGDQKQLPPTSFFEKVALDEGDEWEEEQFDEFESVLDLCKGSGGLRSMPLRWHYRSHHEDLITFSNYSFYDGDLITFPSAIQAAADVGIELIKVPGVYRRGGPRDNPVEAEMVAKRILFHGREHPHLSLGVVAFSEAQAGAIEVVLERERRNHPELDSYFTNDRLHGFFVKNLENVQGDERDIIIFSVGYGPDEAGKFTLQFGPLNKPGGWRRLNVAITRARRRVEVIASVTAGDFSGDLRNPGVRHLKRYLDYAERGLPALALELDEQQLDVESPFEAEVAKVIRSWGYDVVPQVGCARYRIDLAVRNPEKLGSFALGVECDGVMYHSSKVARDRDRLRQEVLEGLGWRLHRIWGTAWYRNRLSEEHKLESAIQEAIARAGIQVQARPAPQTPIVIEFEAVNLNDQPEWLAAYHAAAPQPPRHTIEMHDPSALPDLKRMIVEVVSVEAPVHEDLVLRRVRSAWGRGRAGARIRDAFQLAVKALTRDRSIVRDRAGFLWLPSKRCTVRGTVDSDPNTRRRIQEVCFEEVQLALTLLAEDARSLTKDELSTRVARIFGWNRRGPDITPVLNDAIDDLISDGVLEETGDFLSFHGKVKT